MIDELYKIVKNNFDIATVDISDGWYDQGDEFPEPQQGRFYHGDINDENIIHDDHEKISGVAKPKKYSPFPNRIDRVIDSEGRLNDRVCS